MNYLTRSQVCECDNNGKPAKISIVVTKKPLAQGVYIAVIQVSSLDNLFHAFRFEARWDSWGTHYAQATRLAQREMRGTTEGVTPCAF